MKNKTYAALCLIFSTLITMIVPVQAEEKSENMFINGGFEESLNHGWYVERMVDYERVTNNPHSGEYCSRNVKDYAGERYCQDFVLVPGETYDYSFWARTEKGHGQAQLQVGVRYGHLTQDTWDSKTGISNVAHENFVTYGEEWTQIKGTFTYTGYDQYGKKLTAHNVQFNVTPNPNIWTDPPLVSYFDDFSLVARGNVKESAEFLPETYNWAEDPIPQKKELEDVKFKDIENNWAASTIEALAGENIINGMDENTYAPDKNVTRAEFITLIMNTFNILRNTKNSGYNDVSPDAWYANSVAMAKNLNLISDKLIENNNFYPDQALTRGEVSSIIVAYANIIGAEIGREANSFTDSDKFGIWAEEIEKASALGILKGYPDGSFLAGKNITRAEIAEVVKKMLELKGRRYFYVDPTEGDDENNDGTFQKPYKSIYKAQEAVRANNSEMYGNIYVFLKAGEHYMNKTLNLSSEDSGSNGYNIIYTSYGDGKAFLNGGESKKYNWEMYDSKKNIYRTYVGALNTRQMYVNGIRAIRARSEEKLKNYSVDLGQEYQAITKSMWITELSDITNVEIVHNGTFYCNYRVLIDSIKKDGDVVRIKYNEKFMNRSRTESMIYFGTHLWVENAYELVDSEGEWFLSKDGYLYYIPRAWENIDEALITLPTTETLINGAGKITDDEYNPIHNLTFRNIEFGYTTGVRQFDERGGLPLCQDALLLPRLNGGQSDLSMGDIEIITAAVQFNNVSYLDFEECTFKKIGNGGLNVVGGIQHNNITANEFYDITSNAMQIGNPLSADATTSDAAENESFPMDKRYYKADINITNNYIHDTAVEFLSAGAMAVTNLQYSNISNNEIFRTSYSGMHTGYGFSARPFNLYYQTSIDHNYIHKTNLLKYEMFDGGAVYHMSTTYGDPRKSETLDGRNKISYNYCEDQGGTVNNIYLDEGAGWMEISHNVFNTDRGLPWTYGVITTGNKGKCNILTDNYLCDDSMTVAGKKIEPYTEWYEKTNGVIGDDDMTHPDMTRVGPQYIIGDDMSKWDAGALDIVANAGIEEEYIDNFHEEFQDFEIVYNDDGHMNDGDNHPDYLPAIYDIETGEETEIKIKAKNRKGTEGYISPDRIQIYNKTPDIVEVTDYNKVKGLKPGKADLSVRIICGRNKDVVDDFPVNVYVDDEIAFFPGSENPILYINGSGGDVKALTGDNIEMNVTLTTKFGRTIKAHEFKATSSNEEFASVDENGVIHGLSEGNGEITFDVVWGASRKTRQYKKNFKIVDHEMYSDFDKSQIVEADDDFINLANWNYTYPSGISDVKEQYENGFKVATRDVAVYTKEKFNNKLLHFKMKINYAGGGWPSLALNCGDTTTNLINEYVFTFYPTCLEWQRFNDGKRTVLWGQGNPWDGTHEVYGVRPGAKIEYNKELDVGIGVFDVPEGVRVVCYIDGLKIFDQIDYKNNEQFGVKDANVLSGGGYFGIHASSNSDNIEIFKPDTK